MRKTLNFRVVVTGVVTALVLTALSCVAYFYYCKELRREEKYRSRTDLAQMAEAVNPRVWDLEKLLGFQYVLYKEAYSTRMTQQGKSGYVSYQDLYFEKVTPEVEFSEEELEGEYNNQVSNRIFNVNAYLMSLEQNEFAEFNRKYDYWVQDLEAESSKPLTNAKTDNPEADLQSYAFLYQIVYDEFGVPTISNLMTAPDEEGLRKDINTVLHKDPVSLFFREESSLAEVSYQIEEAVSESTRMKNPTNCVITIGQTKDKWREENAPEISQLSYSQCYRYFANLGVALFYWVILFFVYHMGLFYCNPKSEEKRSVRNVPRVWLELLIPLAFILFLGLQLMEIYYDMTSIYWNGGIDTLIQALVKVFVLYLGTWYLGGCIGEIRLLGLRGYLDRRSLIVKNWNRLQRLYKRVIQSYREIHLGKDLRKKLLGLLIVNGLVILLFCCLWFAGIVGVVLYSAALYFLLLRYLDKVQKEFRTLQEMTQEMAAGNLKYEPGNGELKLFEPLREDLVSIRNGFDKAVQEEVKSQRMKTELITNVSHDLKTPLTAIITYINLLKEKNLTEEQRSQYLDTLEKKSLRLKTLIEDLFEVSKANSGNVQLNLQSCDLVNLLKQVSLEMQDKLEEKQLITRMLLPEEKVILQLDSEKTYRIYENLFANVAKYAMERTRVYVGMIRNENTVSVIIKNITESELSIEPEELTERFVRGDASRGSVEGSGLGLAIVRSFTELQGGSLKISIDGDLFKVITTWKIDSV